MTPAGASTAPWALVTVANGAGKDRAMAALITHVRDGGRRVAGFLQQREEQRGRQVQAIARIGGDERVPMGRPGGVSQSPTEESFCSYLFDSAAFERARVWLERDARDADVVVIDEVSKLEASGKGHCAALAWALSLGPSKVVVVCVRAHQLWQIVERFGLGEAVATLELPSSDVALASFAEQLVGACPARGRSRGYSGDRDPLAAWTQMHDAHRAQVERAEASCALSRTDRWAERADRFAAWARDVERPDAAMRLLLPRLRPHDVVLDVGAGTGRHARVLARAVERVVAVEPSPSMRRHLEAAMRTEGIRNVEIVAQSWPASRAPACDVAVSVHVAYAVRDLGPFVRAMNDCARRACCLVLGFGAPHAAFDPIWGLVHEETPCPAPSAPEAIAVLRHLGYSLEVHELERTQAHRWSSLDEAAADLRSRLRIVAGSARDARLHAALDACTTREADGARSLPSVHRRDAWIWWTV